MKSELTQLVLCLLCFWRAEQKYRESTQFDLQLLPLVFLRVVVAEMAIALHHK